MRNFTWSLAGIGFALLVACGQPEAPVPETAAPEGGSKPSAVSQFLQDLQQRANTPRSAERPRRPARLAGPDLTPAGITVQELALDSACDLRGYLPRARPASQDVAIAAVNHVGLEGGKLSFGKFTLSSDYASETGFFYAGRMADVDVDVLLDYSEPGSGAWILADQSSGKMLTVPFLPVPSPDGVHWAMAWAFPAPDGAVLIYRRGDEDWERIAVFDVEDACDLRWDDNATLVFRDNTGLPFMKGLGPERRIRHSDGEWRIDPPSPDQPPPNAPDAYPHGGFGAARP